MHATWLHHKPIVYGSTTANLLFFAVVVLHVLPAITAPVSGIVAMATRKGGKVHVRAGRVFVWSMAAVAVSGILIDLVRLLSYVLENHSKYAGYSMPSSYPARLAFLFAGFCVLYMLREARPPRVFRVLRAPQTRWPLVLPGVLVAVGLALAALIVLRYNPWTGALWMIGTFCVLVVLVARGRLARAADPAAGVAQHGIGMGFLAAFSWWGALQGFGPGIAIALRGADQSTTPYRGNQPGPFTPAFWFFLLGWATIFLLGLFLIRRVRRRRVRAVTAGAGPRGP